MKRGLVFLLLGALLPMVQSVSSAFVPARFVPDLGLLFVFALALLWRNAASGLLLAAFLGFATDLLSGSLLGQHALMRVLAYGVARFCSRHLNLRGPLPQAAFVAALTGVYALGLGGVTTFFGRSDIPLLVWRDLLPHALVTGVFAPPFAAGFLGLQRLLGEDEDRRMLRLAPRGRSA